MAEVCKHCPMGRVKLCGAEPLWWDGSWWSPSSAASESRTASELPFLVSQVTLSLFITQVCGGHETDPGTELAPGERQQSHLLGPSVPTKAQCRHLGYRDHPTRSRDPETNVPGELTFRNTASAVMARVKRNVCKLQEHCATHRPIHVTACSCSSIMGTLQGSVNYISR